MEKFGKLDILVSNAAEQHPKDSVEEISEEQLRKTFETNVFPMFYLTAAALPHLRKSAHPAIILTTSVTAYRGSPHLLDYSAAKGSIASFTRSLSGNLAGDNIRVNGVAPGTNLDTAHPLHIPGGKSREVRIRHSPWARGATMGVRDLLCFPR